LPLAALLPDSPSPTPPDSPGADLTLASIAATVQGRAVQVDPMKLTLKLPGTKRLKLEFDELLSSFAFKFNLRRYS
jgi:hypothetical protein